MSIRQVTMGSIQLNLRFHPVRPRVLHNQLHHHHYVYAYRIRESTFECQKAIIS